MSTKTHLKYLLFGLCLIIFLSVSITNGVMASLDNEKDDLVDAIEEGIVNANSLLEQTLILEKTGAEEASSLSNTYGRYYDLPYGRKAALISSTPIQFKKPDGKYEFVDNRIVSITNHDKYQYKNASHAFSVFFPEKPNKDTDILFETPYRTQIHLWNESELWYVNPSGARSFFYQAENSFGKPDRNSIRYSGRYPGISEIFSLRFEGIKHSIEIDQLPSSLDNISEGILEFEERVILPEGAILSIEGTTQSDNFITEHRIDVVDSTGESLGYFPSPWARDNGSLDLDIPEQKLSYNVIFFDQQTIALAVRIPFYWLKDSIRSYPVTIDSSYYYYENHSYDDCYQLGADSQNYNADYFGVGYSSDYGLPYFSALMTMHEVNIPPGSTINYSSLNYYPYQDHSNTTSFKLQFENTDNADACANENPSNRSYVSHSVGSSSYSTNWTGGTLRYIEDLSASLQDVIDRPGWSTGNSVGLGWLTYTADGSPRYVYSYDGGYAPFLYVEYTEPEIRIEPPVGAGPEFSFTKIARSAPLSSESTNSPFIIQYSNNYTNLAINYKSGVPIHHEINNFDLFEIKDGKTNLEGEPNQPLLPVSYLHVLVPQDSRYVRVDNVSVSSTQLPGTYSILPSPELEPTCGSSRPETYLINRSKDFSNIKANEMWPAEPVEYVNTLVIRGYKFLVFKISPLQYNPATGIIIQNEQIQFSPGLTFDDPIALTYKTHSDEFSGLTKQISDNPTDLNLLYPVGEDPSPTNPDVEYLIITSSSMVSNFQALADWKTSKGTSAVVLTTDIIYANYSGSDNQEKIKSAIVDYTQNEGTIWVLLGGDNTIVPDRDCYGKVNTSDGLVIDNTIPTDLYYSGLDDMNWDDDGDANACEASGDTIDFGADVFLGRAPVRTGGEANAFVTKVMKYQDDPPAGNFAEEMILIGVELWNTWDGRSDADWRSEKMYTEFIDPYWNPERLRFYDTNTDFGGADYNVTVTNLQTQINDGYNHIFMATHGSTSSWSMESGSSFVSSYATSLTNTGKEGIVYTMACNTNGFDHSSIDPCLSEAFIRNANGGAVAYIGSSRFGWGWGNLSDNLGPSFQYASQFYKQLFTGSLSSGSGNADPNDYPNHLGAVHAGHKLYYSGSSNIEGAMRWLQFSLNLMGDPQLEILTQDPNHFTIYNDGTSPLQITDIIKQNSSTWLTVTPQEPIPLEIEPGESVNVGISIDSTGLSSNLYNDRILVYSNDADKSPYPAGDPNDPNGGVDVRLEVTSASQPDLTATAPTPSVIPPYYVGQQVNWSVTVTNNGDGAAQASHVGYYLGDSCSDTSNYLSSDSTSALSPGEYDTASYLYTFEAGDVGTSKYFVVKADYQDEEPDEEFENNNTNCYGPFEVRPAGGITLNPTGGLQTSESGGFDTFTIVLDSLPTANVTIGISSSDTAEGSVSTSSVTFTPSNWYIPQTITVTGVDDTVLDGDIAYTIITASAVSSDLAYNGINPIDVSVTNIDNETHFYIYIPIILR